MYPSQQTRFKEEEILSEQMKSVKEMSFFSSGDVLLFCLHIVFYGWEVCL